MMGQVTKETLRLMKEYAERGTPEGQYPLTCNEVLQLVYLAGMALDSSDYKAREAMRPRYIVYEDIMDEASDSIQMRQHEFGSPYLDEALDWLKSNPKCNGIMAIDIDGTEVDDGVEYFQELLRMARTIWNPATLMQVLALRPDLAAKMPERMPKLRYKTQREADAAYVHANIVVKNVEAPIGILPATHDPL
jgi:hypothetical protein